MINLIYCTLTDWQYFMNNCIGIRIGQPVVKADKQSALLPIEQRCNLITEAQPKVKGFIKSKNRLYLPNGIDQVALFLLTKDVTVSMKWFKKHVVLEASYKEKVYKAQAQDWYEASGKVLLELQKDGVIK